MQETKPEVYLIARTEVDYIALGDYLGSIGAGDWLTTAAVRNPPSGELLVEAAGRLCYRSWKPGLNPNVTKVRTDSGEYLRNILESKHGSVLEHVSMTFIFQNVSRVFTHELVRHRVGVGISQESLRYVRLTDIGFRIPEVLEPMREEIIEVVEKLESFQKESADRLGLDVPGTEFHKKKEATSALRRLAPLGLSTNIMWSANVRTLRHVIEQRTSVGAEEEIRTVFNEVAKIAKLHYPLLFQDFERDGKGAWTTPNSKV